VSGEDNFKLKCVSKHYCVRDFENKKKKKDLSCRKVANNFFITIITKNMHEIFIL